MNRTGLALILFLVVLSGIPFLTAGYGTDPDAWRVAEVGAKLWQTGVYEVSRFPGYPLHECVSAPFVVIGGAPLSNAITLLCSLFLLYIWNRIALREARHPAALVIIFAFTPLFWKNSAVTMDYAWSLLCLLLAFAASLQRRALMAGVFLGLAAGFRPANAIAGAALLIPFLTAPRPVRSVVVMGMAASTVAATAFAPLFLSMGVSGWLTATSAQLTGVRATQNTGISAALYRGVYTVGPLAAAFIAVIGIRALRGFRAGRFRHDVTLATAVAMVLLYGATFIWLPMEREYLLPALPFLLLAVDRICTRREILLAGVFLVSFAFVNPDIVAHEGVTGHIHPALRTGMVLEDLARSHDREVRRSAILSISSSDSLLVITGFPEPYWFGDERVERIPSAFHEQLFGNHTAGNARHIYALTRSELALARSQGYRLAAQRGAERLIEQIGGFSIAAEGLVIVPALP